MNRLNLDFSLPTIEERTSFINQYILRKEFKIKPPTEAELETMGNYILWGKTANGKNVHQLKEIQLESRAKTWDTQTAESLDELRENPAFQEASLRSISEPRILFKKEVFSRSEARQKASPEILLSLESLWKEIDTLDLLINFYDLEHNKRIKPPRELLLKKFSQSEQEELRLRAQSLTQFHYLKLRHLLVEKRREQFSLKDSYSNPITRQTQEIFSPSEASPDFETDIPVYPFGLNMNTNLDKKIFPLNNFPNPNEFSEKDLSEVSKRLWTKSTDSKFFFDFRILEHVYQFLLLLDEIDIIPEELPVDSTLSQFYSTFNFYRARARLSPLQEEILDLKIHHYKNQDIANIINPKYQKTYNANYISTIFRQKIITSINAAAAHHLEVLENIFFPENFKQCKDCKEILLLTNDNFIRKNKSKDGYSPRCKRCDKEQRIRRVKK